MQDLNARIIAHMLFDESVLASLHIVVDEPYIRISAIYEFLGFFLCALRAPPYIPLITQPHEVSSQAIEDGAFRVRHAASPSGACASVDETSQCCIVRCTENPCSFARCQRQRDRLRELLPVQLRISQCDTEAVGGCRHTGPDIGKRIVRDFIDVILRRCTFRCALDEVCQLLQQTAHALR